MNKHSAARLVSLVALAAGSLSLSAQAAELGFYVAGSFGNTTKDIDKAAYDAFAQSVYADFDYQPTSTVSTFDDESHGYSFAAGYRLYSWLAVEGGYLQLGKQRYVAQSQGTFPPVTEGDPREASPLSASVNAKTGGFALSALGIVPLSYRWEMFGRAGVMFATNERTLFLTDGVNSLPNRVNGSSTDLLVGAGASFTFAEIYGLRAEYLRVFDAGDDTVGEADTDLITLGVTVKF